MERDAYGYKDRGHGVAVDGSTGHEPALKDYMNRVKEVGGDGSGLGDGSGRPGESGGGRGEEAGGVSSDKDEDAAADVDAAVPLRAMYATLRALSPNRNVRTASAPATSSPDDDDDDVEGRKYSPALVRAFQPGSRFPLHFDSLRSSVEWDVVKVGRCGLNSVDPWLEGFLVSNS